MAKCDEKIKQSVDNDDKQKLTEYLNSNGYKLEHVNCRWPNTGNLYNHWIKIDIDIKIIVVISLYNDVFDYYDVIITSDNNIFKLLFEAKCVFRTNAREMDSTINKLVNDVRQKNQFFGYCQANGYLLDDEISCQKFNQRLKKRENGITKLISIDGFRASFTHRSTMNGIGYYVIFDEISFDEFIKNHRKFNLYADKGK